MTPEARISTSPSGDLARVDLHCHTSASLDGSVDPIAVLTLAHERGLTHLAITDHDSIDGAVTARDRATPGIFVIVGQEIRSTEGDMIGLFLAEPIPSGMSPEETSSAVRRQGGLVGLPHPFDPYRPSIGRGAVSPGQLARLAQLADYVEVHNGRIREPAANTHAADFARQCGLPGVAVTDAHTERELGMSATLLQGPVSTPAELLTALRADVRMHVREGADDERGLLVRLVDHLREGHG